MSIVGLCCDLTQTGAIVTTLKCFIPLMPQQALFIISHFIPLTFIYICNTVESFSVILTNGNGEFNKNVVCVLAIYHHRMYMFTLIYYTKLWKIARN